MKICLAFLATTVLSTIVFGFETGKYHCVSEKAGPNGQAATATFLLSKVTLNSDAGPVTLPYMEYNYDDKQGNKAYAKGIAQVSGDTWSNTFDAYSISMDSDSYQIVFKGSTVASRLGLCQKVK